MKTKDWAEKNIFFFFFCRWLAQTLSSNVCDAPKAQFG